MELEWLDTLYVDSIEDFCNKFFRPNAREEKKALLAQSGISDLALAEGDDPLAEMIDRALEIFCGKEVNCLGLWPERYSFYSVREEEGNSPRRVIIYLFRCPAIDTLLTKKDLLPCLLGIHKDLDSAISPLLKEK